MTFDAIDAKLSASDDPHRLVAFEIDTSIYAPEPEALDFLHSAISSDDEELKRIVLDVQKKAYALHPFPCILRYAFITLRMAGHPTYPEVVLAAKSHPNFTLLDLGCCMGTDVRKAVRDGVPADRIIGSDILPAFIDMGHKLFNDAGTCKISFVQGDVFALPDPTSQPAGSTLNSETDLTPPDPKSVKSLSELVRKTSHIFTSAVFHLFNEAKQAEMARKLATLVRRHEPGSLLFGQHVGGPDKGFVHDEWMAGSQMFVHRPESWKALWIDTFTALESTEFVKEHIVVDASLKPRKDGKEHAPGGSALLQWTVRIV